MHASVLRASVRSTALLACLATVAALSACSAQPTLTTQPTPTPQPLATPSATPPAAPAPTPMPTPAPETSAASTPSLAPAPTVEAPVGGGPSGASLVMLAGPLDEPEFYCVDVAGFGANLSVSGPLQAHTCKPGADDELFAFNRAPRRAALPGRARTLHRGGRREPLREAVLGVAAAAVRVRRRRHAEAGRRRPVPGRGGRRR